jgi:hypothetical protein
MNQVTQNPKTYVRELPLNIPVRLSVEGVTKKAEDDSMFTLECRICDGPEVGNLIMVYFYRRKRDGQPRVDTQKLFAAIFPKEAPDGIPSRRFIGKIFEASPWKPENAKYQLWGKFKYVGENNDTF